VIGCNLSDALGKLAARTTGSSPAITAAKC